MRKLIIDTDTGSDDAVALLMAAMDRDVDILGITTVSGNVPLAQGTRNALMTMEISGRAIAVHPGCAAPLCRQPVSAVSVHGQDGMGDAGLIHPAAVPDGQGAVDFILSAVRSAPDIDIVMLGPATNIALALLTDRQAMSRVHRIYSMGTAGLGRGNTTPVAEFNVFADAEAYRLLLESGIPLTVIGFDMCCGPAAWDQDDLSAIAASGPVGRFSVDCNRSLLAYNIRKSGRHIVDLPDAVAMSCALWPDTVKQSIDTYAWCSISQDRTYGQVIIYDPRDTLAVDNPVPGINATVITSFDHVLYKQRLRRSLSAG